MAPSTPKKVSKTKANTKKLIYDQATLDQKMYFLWLHLQLKQGNKVLESSNFVEKNAQTNEIIFHSSSTTWPLPKN